MTTPGISGGAFRQRRPATLRRTKNLYSMFFFLSYIYFRLLYRPQLRRLRGHLSPVERKEFFINVPFPFAFFFLVFAINFLFYSIFARFKNVSMKNILDDIGTTAGLLSTLSKEEDVFRELLSPTARSERHCSLILLNHAKLIGALEYTGYMIYRHRQLIMGLRESRLQRGNFRSLPILLQVYKRARAQTKRKTI